MAEAPGGCDEVTAEAPAGSHKVTADTRKSSCRSLAADLSMWCYGVYCRQDAKSRRLEFAFLFNVVLDAPLFDFCVIAQAMLAV